MIKEVYLIRHSKPLKVNNDKNMDSLQIQNEKQPLSIEGENIAREKLNIDELKDIDKLYSSSYVRAISTAKYIAENNNIEINVINDFGERKFGINSWDELPDNFGEKQFLDENYKTEFGESQKEVRERIFNALMNVLKNDEEKIAIVFHSTAMLFLIMTWCKVIPSKEDFSYKLLFNDEEVFNGKIDYCEIFKLTFDDKNKLINIENIKHD
jgi:2,3-bisphosphoglycerate-dependent phosphoglycerate mutase